jgi:hypothetical protein
MLTWQDKNQGSLFGGIRDESSGDRRSAKACLAVRGTCQLVDLYVSTRFNYPPKFSYLAYPHTKLDT